MSLNVSGSEMLQCDVAFFFDFFILAIIKTIPVTPHRLNSCCIITWGNLLPPLPHLSAFILILRQFASNSVLLTHFSSKSCFSTRFRPHRSPYTTSNHSTQHITSYIYLVCFSQSLFQHFFIFYHSSPFPTFLLFCPSQLPNLIVIFCIDHFTQQDTS